VRGGKKEKTSPLSSYPDKSRRYGKRGKRGGIEKTSMRALVERKKRRKEDVFFFLFGGELKKPTG